MNKQKLSKETKCLNGWWDILPVYDGKPKDEVPADGWLKGEYLVPSYWNKHKGSVRRKGDKYFTSSSKFSNEELESEDIEFLFDAYEYPVQWSKTKTAWVKRSISISEIEQGWRYFLCFDAVASRCKLYINGKFVCKHIQAMLPLEVDVSELLETGENEIALLIEDFEKDENGKCKSPSGNGLTNNMSGIWQDVFLIQRSDVYLKDITIRTYTRTQKIWVQYEIFNASDEDRNISVFSEVTHWEKGENPEALCTQKIIGEKHIKILANTSVIYEVSQEWKDAIWWYPENPKLYTMRTRIVEDESLVEESYERFGFREVWFEGHQLMLNDYPLHLFSDWGHKFSPFHHTKDWIKQWFGMIKDGNMNHSRLHVHPHIKLYMELADEEGILITGETALHGSGGGLAGDSPEFWEAVREHIFAFIRRDKNHPCVIAWSVENEMRWNRDETVLASKMLPEMQRLFKKLDPTRPAYHDGDSSLWDERTQEVISRHYGKESSGLGWWDKSRPLFSSEMSIYHYAGPNNTLFLGGDEVFAKYKVLDESQAKDTAYIIETARTIGVSALGPWNQSCIENLRMETDKVKIEYDDYECPGVKPLFVQPRASEFSFWKEGKGYTPFYSFPIQANAFRPLAIIDRSLKDGYFAGSTFKRELFIVNDTSKMLQGELKVLLTKDSKLICEEKHEVSVGRGKTESIVFAYSIPKSVVEGVYQYSIEFRGGEELLDAWTRDIKISRSIITQGCESSYVTSKIGVFGNGSLKKVLESLKADFEYISKITLDALGALRILLIEMDAINEQPTYVEILKGFVKEGGRVIIMEQSHSIFPTMPMENKAVLKAFVRAYGHETLEGINEADLFSWGEDPYPFLLSDSFVAKFMYRKNDAKNALFLIDSGEGSFGNGDLAYTPLFEAPEGEGLLIGCQLRLTEKMGDIPTAEGIFLNLLRRADSYKSITAPNLIVAEAINDIDIPELAKAAFDGDIVIVNNSNSETLKVWGQQLNMRLDSIVEEDVYQIVRVKENELLSGVSNEDTCGIEKWTYAPSGAENLKVGEIFIQPEEGLISILETPTESCLKELFVHGGRSEVLRAHTVSRFLYDEKPSPSVALGMVQTGEGKIIFNQFNPPIEKRIRYSRLMNRLKANMGLQCKESIFEGDRIKAVSLNSFGYPREIMLHSGSVSTALYSRLVEEIGGDIKEFSFQKLMDIIEWCHLSSNEGIWKTGVKNSSDEVLFFYNIDSPTLRKDLSSNMGLPNPEALTFMDAHGEGRLELTVNGRTYSSVTMENGIATVSDISLEMGINRILVRWKPLTSDSSLQMKWRNIMRQVETSFTFTV